VGLWIAEIDKHAVAKVLRHKALEALHHLRDTLLIGRDNLAEVFGVHASREGRRPHQIREQHRDLTALGELLDFRLRRRVLR